MFTNPITIRLSADKTETINYNEVPIANTSYSKVVLEDGRVGVVIHIGYGSGWSTRYSDLHNNKQYIFDSRLVIYLLSDEYKTLFKRCAPITDAATIAYKKFISSIFPDMEKMKNFGSYNDVVRFTELSVSFIPENTKFRIQENDGSEYIEILNLSAYISA
jgi:hypothetical protein